MKQTKLIIQPYKNHAGSISWRVSGTLHGVRIRQNFQDKADALSRKHSLELKALQDAAEGRSVVTFLSDAQLREAEAAYLRLKEQKQPRSLSFYLDYALNNYQEPDSQQTLSEAQKAYCEQRKADQAKKLITKVHLTGITTHMRRLDEMFSGILVAELTVEKIIQFCEKGGVSLKTHNNRRDLVSAFLKFAVEKKWIVKNPIDEIIRYDIAHKRGSASALTAQEAAELMEYLETYENGRLVPHYALCLFAGIRPDPLHGEISKLPAKDIHLATHVIHIEPEVSKVNMKRIIDIQPNLAAWLRAYPLDKYPVMVPHTTKHRAAIAKERGLSHDVLRHTFISMHVAKFRSMGDTALQAGNSESIIRKHYLNIKSPAEAEVFFGIMPKLRPVPATAVAEVKPESPAADVTAKEEPQKLIAPSVAPEALAKAA